MWSRIISLAVVGMVSLMLSSANEMQFGISGDASIEYFIKKMLVRNLPASDFIVS